MAGWKLGDLAKKNRLFYVQSRDFPGRSNLFNSAVFAVDDGSNGLWLCPQEDETEPVSDGPDATSFHPVS